MSNLQNRREQLSRQSGLLRAFVPASAKSQHDMQKKYLDERAELLKSLAQLQNTFADDDEIQFRVENSDSFYSAQ